MTITPLRRMACTGEFAELDYVTRDGTDVQFVVSLDDEGFCGTFRCVQPSEWGWCSVGDEEFNLVRRYERVKDYRP